MLKVVHGLTLRTRNNSDDPYLRLESDFQQPQVRTELKGKNSIRYLGHKLNTESFDLNVY